MSFTNWLRALRPKFASDRLVRNRRRSSPHAAGTLKLRLERLEDRRLLAFGAGGIVTTDFLEASGEWIEGLALQTDGRIVAAGNVGLARYRTDGSLDASFNAGGPQPGIVFLAGRYLNDVAIQPDGKIVAGGRTYGTGNDSFLLQRFTTAGIPDPAFGTSGVVNTNFKKTATDEITAIALQPDGKVIAVGTINVSSGNGAWGVARYNPNGSLDTTFDRDGWLTTTFKSGNTGDTPKAVAVQADGKIVVAGYVYGGGAKGTDFAVVRYNLDGSLDQAFGQGGKLLTDFGSEFGQAYGSDEAGAITLQSDGKIVVGGGSTGGVAGTPNRFAIARYNANGSVDSSFGGDGRVSVIAPYDSARHRYEGLAVQADGRIVGVGGVFSVYVTRFNIDGSLDPSFNGTGMKNFQYEPNTYYAYGNDLVVQPDGKVVIGGGSGGEGLPMKFALARINADGSFDAAEPLIAASGRATTGVTGSLTAQQLQPLLEEAETGWRGAGVYDSSVNNFDVRIADHGVGLGDPPGTSNWGSVIVALNDNVDDPGAVANGIINAHGGQVGHVYEHAVKGFSARVSDAAVQALMKSPLVKWIEPDLEMRAFGQLLPTGVDRIDADQNNTAKIDGIDERINVDIAILDTGIDAHHPDLNVVGGYNATSGPTSSWDDGNGHGTHVAGTAAALDNRVGVVGVAPGARLWAVKVLGNNGIGKLSDIIEGIDWVTANAATIEVVNMSLGGQGVSAAYRAAIQRSVAAGVVYVVAAGNEYRDILGADKTFGTSDDTIPAAYPEVATISAIADSDGKPGGLGAPIGGYGDDTFADFSNFSNSNSDGTSFYLSNNNNPVTSPGLGIDLMLPGVGIRSTYKGGGYATFSGTSMAAPHAAGLAALYIAQHNLDPSSATDVYAIRQALIDGGKPWRSPDGLKLIINPQTGGNNDSPDKHEENLGWAGPRTTSTVSQTVSFGGVTPLATPPATGRAIGTGRPSVVDEVFYALGSIVEKPARDKLVLGKSREGLPLDEMFAQLGTDRLNDGALGDFLSDGF